MDDVEYKWIIPSDLSPHFLEALGKEGWEWAGMLGGDAVIFKRRFRKDRTSMATKIVYYGIWHPERGWCWLSRGEVWTTTVRLIALAQCDTIRRQWKGLANGDQWQVRTLLDWEMSEGPEKMDRLNSDRQ